MKNQVIVLNVESLPNKSCAGSARLYLSSTKRVYVVGQKYDEIKNVAGAHIRGIKNLVNKFVNMLQRVTE